jgi:peptidylamidoglycolate lyase
MFPSGLRAVLVLSAAVCVAGVEPRVAAQKGGGDETGPYEVVADWPRPVCGEGYGWGSMAGVFAESPDRVYVFQRGCLPAMPPSGGFIPPRNAGDFAEDATDPTLRVRWDHLLMVFDRDGRLVESWDEQLLPLIGRPHRVLVNPYDPDRHVWLVDDAAHQILKFSRNGKLAMTVGQPKNPGSDRTRFNRPTDLAWLPNGDFYVADGYANTRVVKFSAAGEYLLEWGRPGTGPGEFNTVHGIAIDDRRRVYVADRGNSRIQVFDEEGRHLDTWPDVRFPYFIFMSRDQHLWVADGRTQKILKYDLTGKLLSSWGTFGSYPGAMWGPHQFSVDTENNLYIAEAHNGRVQKLRPRPGADPARLVGQPKRP